MCSIADKKASYSVYKSFIRNLPPNMYMPDAPKYVDRNIFTVHAASTRYIKLSITTVIIGLVLPQLTEPFTDPKSLFSDTRQIMVMR